MRDAEIKRGQAVTFRIPSDTSDHLLKQLQRLKETERRNFSRTIADYVLKGVSQSLKQERETLAIPLPKKLTESQRHWLKHEHSEALLGSILYQLIANPMRAASLLASLNSDSVDIDQALYLQEKEIHEEPQTMPDDQETESNHPPLNLENTDDDLADFDWEQAQKEMASSEEQTEDDPQIENADDLLGDFFESMNK